MDSIFKALSDDTRREILELLRKKEMNAGEISDNFSISKPSVSHHLDILSNAGLVTKRRNGQFIYYSLNTTLLDDVVSWVFTLKEKL